MTRYGQVLYDGPLRPSLEIRSIAIDLGDALFGRPVIPITAELTVVDSAGATVQAIDSLPIEFPSIDSTRYEPERETSTYVIDVCRDNAPCNDAEMIDLVRRTVRPGARVTLHVPLATQSRSISTVERARRALREMAVTLVEVEGGEDVVIVVGE